MKNILILLIICAPFLSFSQERHVFWAHGLNGNADFWNDEYARAQRNFRIRSTGFTYKTSDGVSNYANRVRSGSVSIKGTNTIAIGHSMGGVAIREADRDDASLYGGMITFGSPLDGAKLANGVLNGSIDKFVQHSLDELSRGPIATQSKNAWQTFKESVSNVLKGNGAGVIVRNFASSAILDITSDLTEGFNEAITGIFSSTSTSVKDLAENSAYYNTIKDFSNSKPKIFAYGEESSPVHARMFISSITLDDQFASLLLTAYNTVRSAYKSGSEMSTNFNIFTCWNSCVDRKKREKEAWKAGYNYMNSGWEIAWNNETGARYTEQYTYTYQVYECRSLAFQTVSESECAYINSQYAGGCSCSPVNKKVTSIRLVNGTSDGFIKKSSQVGALSKWNGVPAKLEGVNHLEMGVHPNTQRLLNDAFTGGRGYDRFFQTSRR